MLHFERLGDVSSQDTCVEVREHILVLSTEALQAWSSGDAPTFYFLVGHASHIIQDSFSTGHAPRCSDIRILKELCVDNKNERPTDGSPYCQHNGDHDYDCSANGFEVEFHGAISSSTGYFDRMGRLAHEGVTDEGSIREYLLAHFLGRNEDQPANQQGYLDCERMGCLSESERGWSREEVALLVPILTLML